MQTASTFHPRALHPRTTRATRAWRALAWLTAVVAFVALIMLSSTAHAGQLLYTQGTAVNNVDSDPATTDTITIPQAETDGREEITDVIVTITISDAGTLFTGDLDINLQHPGGASIQLKPDTAAAVVVASPVVWTFDDDAATTVVANSATGTFRPTQALSAFDTLDPAGTWTLSILDTLFPGEGNVLDSWSLNIQAIPEPGTASMMTLGMLGLAGFVSRRRRRQRSAARR